MRFCLKTRYSHVPFFQIFYEKLPALIHMIGKKNVNSVKTTLYFGPKKSIGCSFFPIFHEKPLLSCPYFVKNVHSRKTNSSLFYILSKTSALLKTKCSHVIFFIFLHKNPILLCLYLVKKRIFCQNYTIFWAIKVNT